MEPELEQATAEREAQRGLPQFAAVWRGEGSLPAEVAPVAQVRAGNLVVEGMLSGVPRYVIRPTPAAGAAARRLRARSFRTAALGELLARRLTERLGLVCLLRAASRFLLVGPARAGWEETLQSLQREFDIWLFQQWVPAGELELYLAGAICENDRLPWDQLAERLGQRRRQPLEGALRIGSRWNGRAFVEPAGADTGLCSGCATVTSVQVTDEETLGNYILKSLKILDSSGDLLVEWPCS